MRILVSVIICTRNHAKELAETLQAIKHNCRAGPYPIELIVVDNGSVDDTAEVVRAFCSSQLNTKYIYEPRKGKAVCLNRALKETNADIIILTDDDVRPKREWIPTMCAPILEGRADAVAGGIKMAPHLRRNWMEDLHRMFLASTEAMDPDRMDIMIGANCAFSRRVLNKVPSFDPELGPGALGFCEDILFSHQLVKAGYRLTAVFDHPVIHHFNSSRLSRNSFVERARAEGRSCAYVMHHWEHREIRFAYLRLCAAFVRLQMGKRLRGRKWPHQEGIAEWEFLSIRRLAFRRQYLRERRRVRRYGEARAGEASSKAFRIEDFVSQFSAWWRQPKHIAVRRRSVIAARTSSNVFASDEPRAIGRMTTRLLGEQSVAQQGR
jgi:glycosyltransferase involved in cell wall biosynthesis